MIYEQQCVKLSNIYLFSSQCFYILIDFFDCDNYKYISDMYLMILIFCDVIF